MFTETNPDKGTETVSTQQIREVHLKFTETNPDKGTETYGVYTSNQSREDMFTETNPDKGTETCRQSLLFFRILLQRCLQKLTPIRGRKHR